MQHLNICAVLKTIPKPMGKILLQISLVLSQVNFDKS